MRAAVGGPHSAEEHETALGDRPAPLTVTLAHDGPCISQARHKAAAFLVQARTEHGLLVSQRATDLTQLVVSELVTDARKRTGPYTCDPAHHRGDGGGLGVGLRSGASSPRRGCRPGGQHDLEIVMAVAQSFDARREPADKSISVGVALLDAPGLGSAAA